MGVVGVVGAVDVASQPLPSLRLVPHAAKHVASIESCRHGHRHRQVVPKLQTTASRWLPSRNNDEANTRRKKRGCTKKKKKRNRHLGHQVLPHDSFCTKIISNPGSKVGSGVVQRGRNLSASPSPSLMTRNIGASTRAMDDLIVRNTPDKTCRPAGSPVVGLH